jgi:hypothetical protein
MSGESLGSDRRAVLIAVIGALATVAAAVIAALIGHAQGKSEATPTATATVTVTASARPSASESPGSAKDVGGGTPKSTQAAGTAISHYSTAMAVGYGIDFGDSKSQPINLNNGDSADLSYQGGVYLVAGANGQISEPNAASPSYRACLNDTVYTTKVIGFTAGTDICFKGHGIIASALITAEATQPIQSLTFEVTVWKAAG